MREFAEGMAIVVVAGLVFAIVLALGTALQVSHEIDRTEVALSALYARVDSLEVAYRGGE